jgi:hypothetical protein
MKKNKILILFLALSGLAVYFVSKNSVLIGICNTLDYICRTRLDALEKTFFFFFFLFFFSLLTYKLPERIFLSWWQFVRIGAPVALALSFLINLELHHSPTGEFQNILDAPALWLLYILFSIGSIISIFVGWRKGSDSK